MSGSAHSDDLLSELGRLSEGSRAAVVASGTGVPLVIWGIAWLAGYCALGWLPDTPALVAFTACVLAASALSWFPRHQMVRSGWEHRLRLGWLTVLVSSPALVAIIAPITLERMMLFLGGLWCLALAVYGVAVRDLPLTGLMVVATFVAGAAPHQAMIASCAFFGLLAGGLTALFGGVRLTRARGPRGGHHGA